MSEDAKLKAVTFTDDGEPDRVTVEIDATALAWLGKLTGQFSHNMCPGGESSHFFGLSCDVWNRFDDDGHDGVSTSVPPTIPKP